MVDAIQGVGQGGQRRPMIDPQIKSQLDQLGLKPTGSKEGDLAAIQAASQTQETQEVQSTNTDSTSIFAQTSTEKTQSETTQRPPIDESIKTQLDELGLKPTGSRQGDLAAINAILEEQKKELFMN